MNEEDLNEDPHGPRPSRPGLSTFDDVVRLDSSAPGENPGAAPAAVTASLVSHSNRETALEIVRTLDTMPGHLIYSYHATAVGMGIREGVVWATPLNPDETQDVADTIARELEAELAARGPSPLTVLVLTCRVSLEEVASREDALRRALRPRGIPLGKTVAAADLLLALRVLPDGVDPGAHLRAVLVAAEEGAAYLEDGPWDPFAPRVTPPATGEGGDNV